MHNCPHCGLHIQPKSPLTIGSVHLTDEDLLYINDRRVNLTGNLRIVAAVIFRGQGRIIHRDTIINALDSDALDRTVDVMVYRIRKAIKEVDPSFKYIKSDRANGYYFDKTGVLKRNRMAMAA